MTRTMWPVSAVAVLGLLLAMPEPARAQTTASPNVRVVIGANVGMARPATDLLTDRFSEVDGPDRNELNTEYPLGNSALLDLNGGVIVGPGLYLGAAFSHAASTAPASATLTLSHPAFHPTLTATATTDTLTHTESDLHLNFGYAVPTRGPLSVLVFGGPTHFSVRQPMVVDLFADEIFNPASRTYSAVLSDLEVERRTSSGWGYNVGTDVSVALTRHIGLGGLARYSRATLEFDQPIRSMIEDRPSKKEFDAGGLELSAGIRFRF